MQKLQNSYFLGPIAEKLGNILATFSLIPALAIFIDPIKDIRSSFGF